MSSILITGKAKVFKLPFYLTSSNKIDGSGSTGFISGFVTESGAPVSRRVMCYHRKTGRMVATTTSNNDGAYRVDGLIAGAKYFVTSLDEKNDAVQYNAVTQDLITASEVIG